MKVFYKILVFVVFMCVANGILSAQTFDIMTENWPPYNFEDEGKVVGISVDIVREILLKVDHPDNIKILPWARAYEYIKKKDNQILFSMGYSEERKDLFKWVGPLTEFKIAFYKRAGSNVEIKSMEDAKKVGVVGVTRSTMSHSILQKNGFTNIDISDTGESLLKKLVADRVDLIISTNNSINPVTLRKYRISDKKVVEAFEVSKRELFIAFSINTPDEIIEKWQKALDELKKTKKYNKILTKYMK